MFYKTRQSLKTLRNSKPGGPLRLVGGYQSFGRKSHEITGRQNILKLMAVNEPSTSSILNLEEFISYLFPILKIRPDDRCSKNL